jgi:cleavage and polyadenylation specificity factor subunit 4
MSRMDECKHGKSCRIKNCLKVHKGKQEKKECLFYKQGFCPHGKECPYRHVRKAPEECPLKATFDQFVSTTNTNIPATKKRKTQAPNALYKISLCEYWLEHGNCPFAEECHYAHGEAELKNFSGVGDLDDSAVFDPTRGLMNEPLKLPSIKSSAYFLIQAPDLRSLYVSFQRGVWAVPTKIAIDMNTKLQRHENVYIFFCVKPLHAIYGIARMRSKEAGGLIPPSAPMIPLSPEFPIEWLRLIRLPLKICAQFKFSDSVPIGRSLYDGELGAKDGYDCLPYLLHTYKYQQLLLTFFFQIVLQSYIWLFVNLLGTGVMT